MPRLPDGDPAPETGELPPEALATLARLAARDLRARAVLRGALRLLRLQHLHADRARPGRLDRDLRRLGPGRARPRRAGCSAPAPARSTPSSSAAARPRCCRRPTSCGASTASGSGSGSAPDAEVTTEANPDSVTAADLEVLAAGGFTRVSIGMQSVVPHVLATLERTHDPARRGDRGRPARRRPGWRRASTSSTARRARASTTGGPASTPPSRSSPTTSRPTPSSSRRAPSWPPRCGAARCAMPEGDDEADKYELADERSRTGRLRLVRGEQLVARRQPAGAGTTRATGAATPGGASGPGAHSHVGGVRWWNVKHPRTLRRAAGRRARRRRPGARP